MTSLAMTLSDGTESDVGVLTDLETSDVESVLRSRIGSGISVAQVIKMVKVYRRQR